MYDEAIMEYEKYGWARPLTEDEVNANDTTCLITEPTFQKRRVPPYEWCLIQHANIEVFP